MIFDIREFTVHDGPGIRTSVFMKGCPLTCSWCHNPEGRARQPQIMRSPVGERVAGKEYTAVELASLLNKQADVLRANEGGVTFTGGEPLLQSEFVAQVIDLLDDVHVLLDTCGFAGEDEFRLAAERADLIFFDLKLIDPTAHRRYTGVDNGPILHNLRVMSALGVPFVIRVPLVPGVTDTDANLEAIAETVRDVAGLVRVDLLPYNRAAGAKYESVGMEFKPDYDETRELNVNTTIFQKAHVPVRVA
ncbi:MAG: radical SAM protein [Chloroflexi bacterium]|nr:radical SAM protein [Chloroflexota bacterium]